MGIMRCSAVKMETVQMCALLLFVLTFALARSDSEIVTLRSTESLTSHCHEPTTMSCNISSQRKNIIRFFAWLGPEESVLCELDKNGEMNVTKAGVNCTFRDNVLVLTIRHTKPVHQGKYLCKLRSTVGTKHSTTRLSIQECLHRLHIHRHDGNVTCSARGIYPEAHIHWFQGSRNLTQSSVTHPISQAKDGTYQIASTLVHSPQSTVNCSLWSPSSGRYLTSTQTHPGPQPSTGSSRADSVGAVGITFALFAAALVLLGIC